MTQPKDIKKFILSSDRNLFDTRIEEVCSCWIGSKTKDFDFLVSVLALLKYSTVRPSILTAVHESLVDRAHQLLSDREWFGNLPLIISYLAEEQSIVTLIEQLLDTDEVVEVLNLNGHQPRLLQNLGLTQGITGLLLALGKVYETGHKNERIEKFLLNSTRYIYRNTLELHLENDLDSLFPIKIDEEKGDFTITNELSYRQGDLCQVLLFYKIARLFGIQHYWNIAELAGLNTTQRRTFEQTQVQNSSFECGSSGLAYVYEYLYQSTKKIQYLQASQFWYRKTSEYLKIEIQNAFYEGKELSVLDGKLGVALSLNSWVNGYSASLANTLLF
jgi:hypothetical protein